jgi:hypothetical protein
MFSLNSIIIAVVSAVVLGGITVGVIQLRKSAFEAGYNTAKVEYLDAEIKWKREIEQANNELEAVIAANQNDNDSSMGNPVPLVIQRAYERMRERNQLLYSVSPSNTRGTSN